MGLRIVGIGTVVPEHSATQSESAELHARFFDATGKRARVLEVLYRRAGVKKRHSVLLEASVGPVAERQWFYEISASPEDSGPGTDQRMRRYEQDAPPLGAEAARRALVDAGLSASAVTHLVTVSCTGFFAPGLDVALAHLLDLTPTIERTHVGFMGCHGALNGLRVASAYTAADPDACVLVCSVELCSLHFRYGWDLDMMVSNALFADGAAAVVGVGTGSPSEISGGGDKAGDGDWTVVANGTCVIPDSREAMSWRIGDHGFRMTLSVEVPQLVEAHVRPWIDGWLAGQGLSLEQVATWAVHPGGPRILEAFSSAAGLADNDTAVSRDVLSEFGNMSSATVLFILERLRASGAQLPCVAIGFGPGLVIEAMLIR
jgi:predicted naringenin-chalcone synthase